MKIFTKEIKETATGKQYGVREFGHTFYIDENEAKNLIGLGQLFYKVNKPVTKL